MTGVLQPCHDSDNPPSRPAATVEQEASMRLIRALSVTLMALGVSLAAAQGFAQSPEGRLTGVVRDSSGAAVPGASLTVTNDQTGASQSAVSGPDGTFTV